MWWRSTFQTEVKGSKENDFISVAGLSGIDSEACEVDIDGESGLGSIGAKSGIITGGFDSRRDAGNLGVCCERFGRLA